MYVSGECDDDEEHVVSCDDERHYRLCRKLIAMEIDGDEANDWLNMIKNDEEDIL